MSVTLGSTIGALAIDVQLCFRVAGTNDPPTPFSSSAAFITSARIPEEAAIPVTHSAARSFDAGSYTIGPCLRHSSSVAQGTSQDVDLAGCTWYRTVER